MFNRLRIYTVHINTSHNHPYENAEFIEEGFNWKAFVFSGIWALYHRLWWAAFLIIAANMACTQLAHLGMMSKIGVTILQLGVHAIVGCYANDLLRSRLKKRGFITVDISSGDSLLRAEQRFFDRYFSQAKTAVI